MSGGPLQRKRQRHRRARHVTSRHGVRASAPIIVRTASSSARRPGP
ncbi:hypothetical protein C7S17_7174 [Burkholderia thailandensis]|nr:hypothetical protein [Burkholderia thailandensis]